MAPSTRTYVAKPTDRERNWLVVDANGKTLGRMATQIADVLRGKRKPEYTPHIDTGDFVVVVNAEKVHVTGNKRKDKRYYRHSGYPGGLRSRSFEEMQARRPEEIIRLAVKGMLPRNRLARKQITKLKIYAGPEHPHVAQKPQPMEIEGMMADEQKDEAAGTPEEAPQETPEAISEPSALEQRRAPPLRGGEEPAAEVEEVEEADELEEVAEAAAGRGCRRGRAGRGLAMSGRGGRTRRARGVCGGGRGGGGAAREAVGAGCAPGSGHRPRGRGSARPDREPTRIPTRSRRRRSSRARTRRTRTRRRCSSSRSRRPPSTLPPARATAPRASARRRSRG